MGDIVERIDEMAAFYSERPAIDHEKQIPATAEISARECMQIATTLMGAKAEILSLRQQIEANGVHADAPREQSAIATARESAPRDGSQETNPDIIRTRPRTEPNVAAQQFRTYPDIESQELLLRVHLGLSPIHSLLEAVRVLHDDGREAFEQMRGPRCEHAHEWAPTSMRSIGEPPCGEGVTPESIRQQIEIARVEEREGLLAKLLALAYEQSVFLLPMQKLRAALEAIRARNGSSPSPEKTDALTESDEEECR